MNHPMIFLSNPFIFRTLCAYDPGDLVMADADINAKFNVRSRNVFAGLKSQFLVIVVSDTISDTILCLKTFFILECVRQPFFSPLDRTTHWRWSLSSGFKSDPLEFVLVASNIVPRLRVLVRIWV